MDTLPLPSTPSGSSPRRGFPVIIAMLDIVIAAGSFYWFHTSRAPAYTLATVERGSIKQEASASGNVAAPTTIDLQFQTGGKLSAVNVAVGDTVSAGDVVAQEDTSVLNAQLQQAQAAVDAQTAALASLRSGTRPEQLAIDENAVTQAKQALRNAIQTAYATADDAVHNKADQFFTNPRTSSAALAFTVPDAQLQNRVQQERVALEPVLSAWQTQITAPSYATTDPSGAAATAQANLAEASAFLDDANQALAQTPQSAQLSAAQLVAYKSAVAAGRLAVAGSLSAITTDVTTLTAAQGALALAEAGTTADVILAQEAQVAQAKANVAAVAAQITQAKLVAPVAGTVTAVNGDPGETVSSATVVVSLLPVTKLQVNVNLSEDNVADVAVGNPVAIALDAFPQTTWRGTVTRIDPAETVIGGAIYYTTTVVFDQPDARVKPGMTANVLIETGSATSTLVIPASALLSTGASSTVEVYRDGGVSGRAVTTGLKSQDGMVEITSGLAEGEQVVTGGP